MRCGEPHLKKIWGSNRFKSSNGSKRFEGLEQLHEALLGAEITRARGNSAKGFIVESDEGRFWMVSIARKLDGKRGPLPQVTFHGYLAAVRFRDHLADDESETRSLGLGHFAAEALPVLVE
jgi:hypothetical protein